MASNAHEYGYGYSKSMASVPLHPWEKFEVIRTSLDKVLVTFFKVSQENWQLIRKPNFGKVTIVTWGGQVKVLMCILGS